jgi:hypothetical protein
MNGQPLVDAIFEVAFEGNDADIKARKDVLWIIGTTLLADVLGRSDFFTKERLLRGVQQELRDALTEIERLMRTGKPKNVTPDDARGS